MARPPKDHDDQRGERLNLRLTRAERMAIEANAAFLGISPTEYARQKALDGRLPQAKTEQRSTAAHATALIRIGNNLNQLTRHTHAGKPLLENELMYCLARIHEELDRIYDPPPDSRRGVV